MKKLKKLLQLSALILLSTFLTPACSAPIDLFPYLYRESGGSAGEGRWAFIEAVNNVTLTELGAFVDPTASSDRFLWEVFAVDSLGVFGSRVFNKTVTYFDDDSLLTSKNAEIHLTLNSGLYALGLTNLDDHRQMMMGSTRSVSGSGFLTDDGNFRVWGAASSIVSEGQEPRLSNNSLLPAFSVNIEGYIPPSFGSVSSPGTVVLIATGLFLFVQRRRKLARSYTHATTTDR